VAQLNSGQLPPIYRFDIGDYTGLGSIFTKFLSNLNLFTLAIYNLVNGGIGYANLQQSVYTTKVLAGATTPISFSNPLSIAPSAVVLGQVVLVGTTIATISNVVSVANWSYDGKSINILNVAGLTSGLNYQISIIVS
jgi:hypothetical protein